MAKPYPFEESDVLRVRLANPSYGARRISRALLPVDASERELRRCDSKIRKILAKSGAPPRREPAPPPPTVVVAPELPTSRLERLRLRIAALEVDITAMRADRQWAPLVAAYRRIDDLEEKLEALERAAGEVNTTEIGEERILGLLARLPPGILEKAG